LILLLGSIIIFLLYLIFERISLNRQLKTIPLRIAVSGSRGKSSVVRMLASVLRKSEKNVLAKTTGSEAVYILPNGEEEPIRRRGVVSIIEQKKLLKKAAKLKVDMLIAEIMSIHPENHFVESHQLLKPNVVIFTNIRLDHVDAMGNTEEEIVSIFCNDITEHSTVFIHENENRQLFQKTVRNAGGKLIPVKSNEIDQIKELKIRDSKIDFIENINLVYSVAKYLNIPLNDIKNGIQKTKYDIGKFKIWKYNSNISQKSIFLVNGFAANDPDSTNALILKLKEKLPLLSNKIIGLLNLRSDRGDRTIQWLNALKNNKIKEFTKVFVTGSHSKIIKRKAEGIHVIKNRSSEKIMGEIIEKVDDQSVLFGFGNLKGFGRQLIAHWDEVGEEYGI